MGLPFVPCFFQSGQYLGEHGKEELKQLIALYKTCREDLFTSTTYPIGDLPDNESWSGFQMVFTLNPNSGHLLLFRELHNEEATKAIRLKFLAGRKLDIEDLRGGSKRSVTVGPGGEVEFAISNAADYSLLRYTVR